MVSTILCVVYYVISLCQKVTVKDNNKIIWRLGQMYATHTLFIFGCAGFSLLHKDFL